MRNLDKFRQAVQSPKSLSSMGYICPKNTFLQLKHQKQRIYPTLLSTTVKTNQIPYLIFETISHFSRHNFSLFFLSQTLCFFDRNNPSKFRFPDFLLLELKFTKLFMSVLKQEVNFSSKFGSLFSVIKDTSSALFQLKLYMLLKNEVHQSASFQTCHCSY